MEKVVTLSEIKLKNLGKMGRNNDTISREGLFVDGSYSVQSSLAVVVVVLSLQRHHGPRPAVDDEGSPGPG